MKRLIAFTFLFTAMLVIGCGSRPYLVYHQQPTGAAYTPQTGADSLGNRLTIKAKRYPAKFGEAIHLEAAVCNPPAADSMFIIPLRIGLYERGRMKACQLHPYSFETPREAGCRTVVFGPSGLSDWCWQEAGDFFLDRWLDVLLLRLPLRTSASADTITLDYYLIAEGSQLKPDVISAESRAGYGSPQYADCVDIRFTLAPSPSPRFENEDPGETNKSLSLQIESRYPDSLQAKIDQAVVEILETGEIVLSLSAVDSPGGKPRTVGFSVPLNTSAVSVRFHITVTSIDGDPLPNGQFWLTQNLLLVPQDVLQTIADLRAP